MPNFHFCPNQQVVASSKVRSFSWRLSPKTDEWPLCKLFAHWPSLDPKCTRYIQKKKDFEKKSSQLSQQALIFCPRQVVASSKLSSLLWRLRQRLMNSLGVNCDERGGHRGCCSYVFMYPIMDAAWTILYWIENSLVTVHYILLLSLLDNFLFCTQLRVQTHNLKF